MGTNSGAGRKIQLAFKNILVWFPFPLWLDFTPFNKQTRLAAQNLQSPNSLVLLGAVGRGASGRPWVSVLIVSRKENQNEKQTLKKADIWRNSGPPRFGNVPNQSPPKARLTPLDASQSISVSCKETDTQIHIPRSAHWAGGCLPCPSFLDPSRRAGLRGWSQDKRRVVVGPCQLHLPFLHQSARWWRTCYRGTRDPAVAARWDPHNSLSPISASDFVNSGLHFVLSPRSVIFNMLDCEPELVSSLHLL